MNVVIGIDPGQAGAATALSAERGRKGMGKVLDSVGWKPSVRAGKRGYLLDTGERFETVSGLVDHLFNEWIDEVASDLGRESLDVAAVALEGMVIPKSEAKSRATLITLIEETGAAADAIRVEYGAAADYRPTAPVWRGRVLKLGAFTSRGTAENRAMNMRDHLFERGHGLHTIHQVESACIAMYAREAYLTGDL